jgi:hypothetical protein
MGNNIYTATPKDYDEFWGATWEAIDFASHEITHSQQSARLGGRAAFTFFYGLDYFLTGLIAPASEALDKAYENNDFEQRARANAARIVKDLKKRGKSPCPIELGNIGVITVSGSRR